MTFDEARNAAGHLKMQSIFGAKRFLIFAVLEGDAPGEAVWASAGCKCVQSDAGKGLQVANVCNLIQGRVCRMS